MGTIEIIGIIFGLTFFLLFNGGAIISIYEKERIAAKRMFLAAIIFGTLFILPPVSIPQYSEKILLFLISVTFILGLFLILPLKSKEKIAYTAGQIDERDIMFSRNELVPDTPKFDEYYKRRSENKTLDDEFRAKPGLMSPNSTYFDHLQYSSADANFQAVELFHQMVETQPNDNMIDVDSTQISNYIKEWGKKIGAVSIGITELKDYHKYTHIGRGEEYGKQVDLNHKYAIALTVEMDKEMVDMAPAGPILMESSQQYLIAGTIAVQIAQFIRELGYPARAHIDANYRVVCPLVARDAGLGEIGRMGLLMTPEFGPRVRIAVVTTDIPLVVDKYDPNNSVDHFCKYCKKCADVCPSQAISFEDKEMIEGVERWQINSEKCFTFWCQSGTDCGRCMSVCPYSHPDNLLHNVVRWGIKNSCLFARVALKLDDFFYGRKPIPQPVQDWLKYKN